MKTFLTILSLNFFLSTSYQLFSQNPLSQYKWENRILLVFTEDQGNTQYQVQKEVWQLDKAGLEERDLLTFEIISGSSSDFSDEDIQFLQDTFLPTSPFTLILIGKDGTEKLRSTQLLSNEKLFAIIDAMPMRKEEMKEE